MLLSSAIKHPVKLSAAPIHYYPCLCFETVVLEQK
jgi:hypothetical protein